MTLCRWQDLPREYGAPTTVWRCLKRWGGARAWKHIQRAALIVFDQHGKLDWSIALVDGSFLLARNGGEKLDLARRDQCALTGIAA
jgi:hypothetical protein